MDRLRVTIPNICTNEIKYVMHCIFDVFLGLEYAIELSPKNDLYIIQFGKHKISIENHFFVSDKVADLYSFQSMPKSSIDARCTIGETEYSFISMFGSEEVEVSNKVIHFKCDVIASIYFMLSRWEETVVADRDVHDRFQGKSSFAFKNNFLDRPVVNEYVELIWQSLIHIGYNKERKKRKYNVVPTHDIDDPLMWMNSKDALRSIMFSMIKSPNFSELYMKLVGLVNSKDPYDNYEELMNIAETYNAKATFYFLTGGNTQYDRSYLVTDPKVNKIIKRVENRNHTIGLHPSYDTYMDTNLLSKEKSNFTEIEVQHSRQHYLRVSVPYTWSILQESGIQYDSTMGYADVAGFRCGVCYEFPLFDCNARVQLEVIEQPLIVMDVTLTQYEALAPNQCINRITDLQGQVRKYNGDFVFLWHNSSFNTLQWKDYENVFYSLYNL